MRRTFAALLAVCAVGAAASVATAANAPDKRVTALQKQVATLQKQVKTLQGQVRQLDGVALALIKAQACEEATTADVIQGTWGVIDQIAQATQAGKTYFGAQAQVNDYTTCTQLKITRPGILVPPNSAVFSSLTQLLAGPSSSLRAG